MNQYSDDTQLRHRFLVPLQSTATNTQGRRVQITWYTLYNPISAMLKPAFLKIEKKYLAIRKRNLVCTKR